MEQDREGDVCCASQSSARLTDVFVCVFLLAWSRLARKSSINHCGLGAASGLQAREACSHSSLRASARVCVCVLSYESLAVGVQ